MKQIYQYNAKLVRVVDGDTIDVNVDLGFDVWVKQRLRLKYIDAPEMRGASKEAGLLSKQALEDYIRDTEFYIETEKRGKFGRYIAELFWLTGESINERMIQEGYAVPYE